MQDFAIEFSLRAAQVLRNMVTLSKSEAITSAINFINWADGVLAPADPEANAYLAERKATDVAIILATTRMLTALRKKFPTADLHPMSLSTLGINLIEERDMIIVMRTDNVPAACAALLADGWEFKIHYAPRCKHMECKIFGKDGFEVKVMSTQTSNMMRELHDNMLVVFNSSQRRARFTYCRHVLNKHTPGGLKCFICLIYMGHMNPENGIVFREFIHETFGMPGPFAETTAKPLGQPSGERLADQSARVNGARSVCDK